MELYKRASVVAAINLRSWLKDIRVRFLFVCIGCYVIVKLFPFASYGFQAGKKLTPWLLPMLFKSDTISINLAKSVLHIGMVLLLCNAPFLYPTTPYIVLRSRRNAWWIGECLYIIEAALIYVLFLSAVCFLVALPVITFAPDWGDALRDLVIGTKEMTADEIRWGYGIFNIPGKFTYYLAPLRTQIYTFLASWASFSILGLLMYLVSLIQKRATIGIVFAGVLIFADPLIYSANYMNRDKIWIDLLSPVCWTDAGLLKDVSARNFLSVPLVVGMYLLLIAVLCAGICIISRRIPIEIADHEQQG